ncbi:hypothetical protein O4214_27940 [Rhodococcus erythropolis]|uniref:hypothetical protein n=1 Tax=Rhodococcus erythropolis TaxID=1833 RepID=UPI0022B5AC86|nr:hypothetical protein [Rhodococcus erythropolis]MCD2108884.1 hypothetical protein [Rhodococcus qingshengii]MCZ4527821.1 hypothetical protein [Rhodococcus erythropolis]
MSEQIDYPLSSPLDELSEWQRVVRPLRVSADGYLRLATNRLAVDSDYTWDMHRHSDHELLWAIDGVLEVRTPETVYTVPSGVSLWIPSFVPPRGDGAQRHRIVVHVVGGIRCDRVGSCGGLVHPAAARTSTRSPHPRRLDGRGASAS